MIRKTLKHMPLFELDAAGNIYCKIDPEYIIPRRIAGRRKRYSEVQLMFRGTFRWYRIHRLMARSWLGESDHNQKTIVDHIDGDSLNNRIENLRWVTPLANSLNRRCYGLVREKRMYYPRVAGYVHRRYGTTDEELALMLRSLIVESYVRYNSRFPQNGNVFPDSSIYLY